ncbi:ABC transporter permease [Variovorax sp. VaC1]|uniref:ABC transporter permease n=1 Tax=Variovorax sp. VaC1 TaxID=3373132 RepID=UPI00374A35F1
MAAVAPPSSMPPAAAVPAVPPALSRRRQLWRRACANRPFMFGLGLLVLIVLLALAVPLFYPHDPYAQDLTRRTVPPAWYARGTWEHVLGTDALGRDYLARLLHGGRVSLLISLSVVLISGSIGTTLGVLAGYFAGKVDLGITFLITAFLAMPSILIALVIVSMVGSSLTVVILVLGLLMWIRFAVVTRTATQQIRALDYVAAAQAVGASRWRIVFGEVLPNVMPQVIVVATLEAASAIMVEAALSFLGLGVQPPTPSWGLMIAEARSYMFFSFWLIAIPGISLGLLALAINLVGDGLRDLFAAGSRN